MIATAKEGRGHRRRPSPGVAEVRRRLREVWAEFDRDLGRRPSRRELARRIEGVRASRLTELIREMIAAGELADLPVRRDGRSSATPDAALRVRIWELFAERAAAGLSWPTRAVLRERIRGVCSNRAAALAEAMAAAGELPDLPRERTCDAGSITASGRDDHARRAAEIRLEWERAARDRPRKVRRAMPTIREEIRELRRAERRIGVGRAS